jgi:D-alanine-D-alanine ligase
LHTFISMDERNYSFRREVRPGDVEVVRDIVISTGFFYDIEVPVAVELVEDRLMDGEESTYQFLFVELEGQTVAYSCYGPVMGTEGSFDLYWIVTHNDYRGKGLGRALLTETHREIRDLGGRLCIAETSSLEKYIPTRNFYLSMGYEQESLIRDFYKPGDHKVTFVKRF